MKPLPHPLVVDGRFQLGRYDRPFPKLNFLDASPRGFLRRLRLKEWQAFQFSDGRYFAVVALFDAKFLGLVQAKVWDSETGTKHLFERKVRSASMTAPDQILDGRMEWTSRGASMRFHTELAKDRARVEFDLPATKTSAAMKARIEIDYAGTEPVVVCLPFDEERALYSQKGVAPASGELVLGEERVRLDPAQAFALIDDHRGFYPRVMQWDWLTTGGRTEDGTLWGLNLTRNQCLHPERYNENVLWRDGRATPIGPVHFERSGNEPGDHWTIQGEGVDLVFEVELAGRVDLNLGLFESRYRGPFGRVRGRVAPEGTEPFEIDGALAMGERFWLKA